MAPSTYLGRVGGTSQIVSNDRTHKQGRWIKRIKWGRTPINYWGLFGNVVYPNNTNPPAAINPNPAARVVIFAPGSSFSAKTKAEMTATQTRSIAPTAKSSSISSQQQPRQ